MIKLAGISDDIELNRKKIMEVIENGKAFEKFKELVKKQGGDVSFIEDTNKFKKAQFVNSLKAEKSGYINKIDAKIIGEASVHLGAGRAKKEDDIDHSVGIVLNKKVADYVKEGEDILYIHSNDEHKAESALLEAKNAIEIVETQINKPNEIFEIVK